MKEAMKRIKIESVKGAAQIPAGNERMDAWTVTIRLDRRQMTIPYFKGEGHKGASPGKTEVLECLLLDASAGNNTFEEFCSEFGYDTDSRRAEATWKACVKIREKLIVLLGDYYDEVEEAIQQQ